LLTRLAQVWKQKAALGDLFLRELPRSVADPAKKAAAGLDLAFAKPIVTCPPFSVLSGNRVSALIGPSGCGKTTSLFNLAAEGNVLYMEPAIEEAACWDNSTAALLEAVRADFRTIAREKSLTADTDARLALKTHVAPFLLARLLLLKRFQEDRGPAAAPSPEGALLKLMLDRFLREHSVDLSLEATTRFRLEDAAKEAAGKIMSAARPSDAVRSSLLRARWPAITLRLLSQVRVRVPVVHVRGASFRQERLDLDMQVTKEQLESQVHAHLGPVAACHSPGDRAFALCVQLKAQRVAEPAALRSDFIRLQLSGGQTTLVSLVKTIKEQLSLEQQSELIQELLRDVGPCLVAIDEAHVIANEAQDLLRSSTNRVVAAVGARAQHLEPVQDPGSFQQHSSDPAAGAPCDVRLRVLTLFRCRSIASGARTQNAYADLRPAVLNEDPQAELASEPFTVPPLSVADAGVWLSRHVDLKKHLSQHPLDDPLSDLPPDSSVRPRMLEALLLRCYRAPLPKPSLRSLWDQTVEQFYRDLDSAVSRAPAETRASRLG
jgi:hypothetical protein